MRTILYAVAAASFGCSPFGGGAFNCTDDSQCTRGGMAGTCQGTGFCSFADDTCPSGQRYGDSSGGLGGVCVGDEPPSDARSDGVTASCVIDGLDLCDETPLPAIAVGASETIDTDTDPRCITFPQAGGGDACLVYAQAISVAAGQTLSAIGSRPLVIASVASITLAGELDVSSRRGGQTGAAANHSACTIDREAESDLGGAAGAAGGSFGGEGGDGGDGDTDNSLGNDGNAVKGDASDALAAAPAFARGGCRGANGGNETGPGGGNGGGGGASGGAALLVANDMIEVSGAIRAMGAGGSGGGDQAGGGGGGSGGFIKLAATALTISGSISANGGGGGEGGCNCSGVETPGNPGTDGALGTGAAGGGAGASGPGGDGGASGAATPPDGLDGSPSVVGSGGGGGGAGFVVFVGTVTITGVVSPPPE
ncbi:MAG TPA: hypothetical protein VIU61_28410 [Kofleriaceae bacterium]